MIRYFEYLFSAVYLACAIASIIRFRRSPAAILGGIGFGLLLLNRVANDIAAAISYEWWHLTFFRWNWIISLVGFGCVLAAIVTVPVANAQPHSTAQPVPNLHRGGRGMFCSKCGRENVDTATYCASCGTALVGMAEATGHSLTSFPVWLLIVLHYVTLGIFSIVWLNVYHGRIPRRRADDPSAGRAVGFLFIPFYNFYWVFFTHMRLCERLDEQRQGGRLPAAGLRPFAIATCVVQVIPYVNFLSYLFLYPIFAGVVQASINELARAGVTRLPVQELPAGAAGDSMVTAHWCPSCAKDSSVGSTYCAFCGRPLAAAAPSEIRAEFHGTGLQYVGWALAAALLAYLVVPAAWGYTAFWRWFVRSIRFSGGTRATYRGEATDVWGSCALLALLGYVSWIPYILASAADEPGLIYLVYVILIVLMPASAALYQHILRRFIGAVELSTGTRPVFVGAYGPILGWALLVYVSAFSIIGWAWAGAAAMRWYCSQIRTPGSRLDFRAKGHELLWRVIVGYLACFGIISIPWAVKWFLGWFIGNVVVVRPAAPGRVV